MNLHGNTIVIYNLSFTLEFINVRYSLWMIIMFQCRFIVVKKYTSPEVGGRILIMGESVYVREQGYMDISVPSHSIVLGAENCSKK